MSIERRIGVFPKPNARQIFAASVDPSKGQAWEFRRNPKYPFMADVFFLSMMKVHSPISLFGFADSQSDASNFTELGSTKV